MHDAKIIAKQKSVTRLGNLGEQSCFMLTRLFLYFVWHYLPRALLVVFDIVCYLISININNDKNI